MIIRLSVFKAKLHQRSKNSQNRPIDQAVQTVFDLIGVYLMALQAGSDIVIVERFADARVKEQEIAFKVQVETAKVHIGRADDAVFIVADNAFRVDKAGRVAINFDSFVHELRVKCFGNGKDIFFVRNMRDGNAYVHARTGGRDQSPLHFSVEDEVGSIDIYVFFCVVNDLQVQIFADIGILAVRSVAESDARTIAFGFAR